MRGNEQATQMEGAKNMNMAGGCVGNQEKIWKIAAIGRIGDWNCEVNIMVRE
jgi:hypothetical protein